MKQLGKGQSRGKPNGSPTRAGGQPAANLPAAAESAAALAYAEGIEATETYGVITLVRDADEATAVLSDVQARIRTLESKRDEIVYPLKEVIKRVNALFKPALDTYQQSKDFLKGLIRAEVDARLAQQRAALALPVPDVRAALAVAPVQAATRQVWQFEVTDIEKVPRRFMTIDGVAIKNALKNGETIDGIKGWTETSVIAR
jgi:hypothetical protein